MMSTFVVVITILIIVVSTIVPAARVEQLFFARRGNPESLACLLFHSAGMFD